jgi:hypothetical protein
MVAVTTDRPQRSEAALQRNNTKVMITNSGK